MSHPTVVGLEALNEPWQFTPVDELKKFYWDAFIIVRSRAPYWVFMM
jgi:glucan 1,3-beta-glucosidase